MLDETARKSFFNASRSINAGVHFLSLAIAALLWMPAVALASTCSEADPLNHICPNGTPSATYSTIGNDIYVCTDQQCQASYCCNIGDASIAVFANKVTCSNPATGVSYECLGESVGTSIGVQTAITSAVTTSTTSITETASTASGQAGTVKAAGDVALTGANNRANAALLLCAQGANREVENAGTGVDDIAACQGKFANADALATMAAKNGKDATLRRDEGMLGQEISGETLDRFQKNFGVDKDDYVNRMLALRGKSSEFADMLSSKFSEAYSLRPGKRSPHRLLKWPKLPAPLPE